MKRKNGFIIVIIGIVLILVGFSYAFFSYINVSPEKNQIVTGNIYMYYNEINELHLENSFPQTKEEGITNDYFEFRIKGKNTSEEIIYYAVNLVYGEDIGEQPRLEDEDLVFYLTEVIDNKEEVLVDSVRYKDINNAKIWVSTIDAKTNDEVEHIYRLRMWISDTVIISDTLEDADYTTSEFNNSYASVKINVIGNLKENDINMVLKANDDNIINGKRTIDVDTYGKENDNLVLEVSSDNENIKFMYQDSKGNEVSELSHPLTINYKSYEDEIITTRVILVPENDTNTNANIYFKLTRNGEVVEEQVKSVLVYGNNYCLNNGFDKLSDCILVSEKLSSSVDAAKTAITAKGTPNFSKTAPVLSYVKKITEDVSNAYSVSGYQFRVTKDEPIFDAATGKYSLPNAKAVTLDEAGTYKDYYTSGGTNLGSSVTKVYKIDTVSVNGSTTTLTKADVYTYALTEDFDTSEIGLYKTTDDDGDSYYYRGSVTNNNVSFAGQNWKIVRINGDGSIRLITTNNVTSSPYNSKSADPTYVGYTYNENFSETELVSNTTNYYNINNANVYYFGTAYSYDVEKQIFTLQATDEKPLISGDLLTVATSANIENGYVYTCFSTSATGTCQLLKEITSTHVANRTYIPVKYHSYSSTSYEGTIGNDNDSTIKTAVDNWYETNLSSYSSYFEDSVFCNDRSITDKTNNSGYRLDQPNYYAPYLRNISNKNPSLLCTNQEDRYTVENPNGNGWLDYPVGLISIDEVMMAGGVYSMMNDKYYLRNNTYFRTGSPSFFSASDGCAFAWFVYPSGLTNHNTPVSNTLGVRPVINIKANVKIASGDGNLDNPYELTLG